MHKKTNLKYYSQEFECMCSSQDALRKCKQVVYGHGHSSCMVIKREMCQLKPFFPKKSDRVSLYWRGRNSVTQSIIRNR